MLVFNFNRIFYIKGIKFPVAWLMKHGFSDKFASGVANDRYKRMNLADVERLCTVFQCTPNDMLEWIPDNKETDLENHFMAPLLRQEKVLNLTKTLNSIPYDKLIEIEKLIQAEVEKGK